MNRFRAVATVALVCVLMAGLAACVSSSSGGGSPMITTTSIPSTGVVGSAYAGATMSTSGGTTPLSYSISSGALPNGITLSKSGTISGTPKSAGSFTFVVQVTDSHNPPRTANSVSFTITVTNPAPPTITCPGTLSGTTCQLGTFALGSNVNIGFTATGASPFMWYSGGTLPNTLSLGRNSGVLTGEATQPGANQPFQVEVADVALQTYTLNCTITISPASQALAVTYSGTPPNGVVGTSYGTGGSGFQFAATGGLAPYSWLGLTGDPPPGLSVNSSGVLGGMPSKASTTAYTFQVEAGDSETPAMTAFAPTSSMFSVTITSNIVVAITNPISPSIDAGAAAVTLNATVSNDIDPTNGVTWTIVAGTPATACDPTCGELAAPTSGNTTLSIVYTPPDSVPASPKNMPTIVATAVDDPSKTASDAFTINPAGAAACPTGNEGALKGSFAYLMKGFDANGAVAIAGSFHADGTGKITEGVEDVNRAGTGPQTNLPINAGGSSYTLGADDRGCLVMATTAGQQTFRFSLAAFASGTPTEGNIIEFDDETGQGTRGSGILRAQDAASFSNDQFANGYAFGLAGFGAAGEHVALAGRLTPDGKGNIAGGNFDRNDAGNLTANSAKLSGTYSIPAGSTTGRGTINASINGTAFTFAAYMVNRGEVILAGIDQVSATNPITSGEAIASAGPFSNGTLVGSHILRETAMSRSGSNPGTRATIGVLTLDGKAAGGVTGTMFEDQAGVSSTTNILRGAATYAVDASTGRITFTGMGTDSPVGYIARSGSGVTAFILGSDSGAADGAMEFQSSGNANFKTASLTGAYAFGTDENVDYAATNESHAARFGSSSGSLKGTSDMSRPQADGLLGNQPYTGAFAFSADGIGTAGADPAVTNGTHIFFIDEEAGSTHPRVVVGEKQ